MLSRFWNLFRRKRLDRELDAELRYHVESLEAEYRHRGLSAEEAQITAIGIVAGSIASFALTRWMSSLLFGVSPVDMVTYAAVSIVLMLAAGLASYLPSLRATHVNPIDALRVE
jgi:hypothetical protein